MSLTQRLSPLTARLSHILSARKARSALAIKWTVEQPMLAIYFGGPVGDLYQVKQWLPVFEELQSEFPTIVLMKDAVAALELAKESRLPIRLAGNADAIEPLADAWGLKALFYVNNNLANFSPLRLPSLRHIHLSHGESEKASMTSNQLKAYDYCFVAGEASAERIMASLALFDESHLKLIGRPQLDQLLKAIPFPASANRNTVLYAPTWEGDRPAMAYSSIAAGESWIRELLQDDKLRVVYRPHPKTGSRSRASRQVDRRIRMMVETAAKADPTAGHIVDLDSDCNPALGSADVAIFDISAMAMDFSILDRPYFVAVPAAMEGMVSASSMWDAARPLDTTSRSGVGAAVNEALSQGPLLGATAFARRHFGDTAENAGVRQFRLAIRSVL